MKTFLLASLICLSSASVTAAQTAAPVQGPALGNVAAAPSLTAPDPREARAAPDASANASSADRRAARIALQNCLMRRQTAEAAANTNRAMEGAAAAQTTGVVSGAVQISPGATATPAPNANTANPAETNERCGRAGAAPNR